MAEDDFLSVADFGGEFLEHFGVKGMRWGVRRKPGADGKVTDVVVTQKKPGTRVSAEGGHNQPAHVDAIAAATARQKARASTLDALSNHEMQTMIKRMQLEQQYSQLMAQKASKSKMQKGQKVIKELLGVGKTANEVMNFQKSPAGLKLAEQIAAVKKTA